MEHGWWRAAHPTRVQASGHNGREEPAAAAAALAVEAGSVPAQPRSQREFKRNTDMASNAPAQAEARRSGPKVLRVGVIHNGRPIEERLFRKPQSVSLGSSNKPTFSIPINELPESFTCFEQQGADTILCFTDAMQGKVSLGEGVSTLESLRQSGKAKKVGDRWQLKLNERSRGKIVVGPVTLLFQFVVPPPVRPKPQLPASMRGGALFLFAMEMHFALILLVSAAIHISSVVWLETTDWPKPRDVAALPDRFVTMLQPPEQKEIEKTEEKVELEKVEGEAAEAAEAKAEEPKPQPKAAPKGSSDPDQRAQQEANRKKSLAKNVENKTILKTIGTLGGAGSPSLVDSLTGGASKTSLDEAFAGSTGVAQGTADVERSGLNRAGSSDASGTGAKAGIGSLGGVSAAKDAGKVDTGDKREAVQVKAQVNIRSPESLVGEGVLDKNAVATVIRQRVGAVQSCYERELKKNPSLKGKLVVQFTIGTAGRVTSASVVSNGLNSAEVGSCVVSRIQSWRFPKPEGGSVTVSKSFVFDSAK